MLEKIPESVGHALINQRAGMENVVYNELARHRRVARLELRSNAFAFNAQLPVRFTADGEGISPPLAWSDLPADADSLALIVEDADSPTPHPLVHAIVADMSTSQDALEEGALDSHEHVGKGLHTGLNSFLQRAWLPPDPPRGHGEHRYVFQVFALSHAQKAVTGDAPGRGAFIEMILERAVAVGCLIGTYEREAREDLDAADGVRLDGFEAESGLI